MRPERLRVLLLIAILATVAIAVTGIALAWTYSSSLQTQRARLLDLVSAREALVDAVWSATSGDPVTTRKLLTAALAVRTWPWARFGRRSKSVKRELVELMPRGRYSTSSDRLSQSRPEAAATASAAAVSPKFV